MKVRMSYLFLYVYVFSLVMSAARPYEINSGKLD